MKTLCLHFCTLLLTQPRQTHNQTHHKVTEVVPFHGIGKPMPVRIPLDMYAEYCVKNDVDNPLYCFERVLAEGRGRLLKVCRHVYRAFARMCLHERMLAHLPSSHKDIYIHICFYERPPTHTLGLNLRTLKGHGRADPKHA